MLSISMMVGGTKVPCAASGGSALCSTGRPIARILAIWASMPSRASAVMTGPISTFSASVRPIRNSASAPFSIASVRSATSSCKHRMRSAEQRWPALSKAEAMTSATTCSASAELSTIIAFCPPVSAISGIGRPARDRRVASWRWISRATSVDPVNITAAVSGAATSAAPMRPSPGSNCSASAGTPASCSSRTASAAISGVSSAGLASTGLPATSAAATWPVKIASGKFHGLMHTTGPSACC